MKKFSIPEPCSEIWNEMSPTAKGAFCQKCSHEVNDVSKFSNKEIRDLLRDNQGQRICVRMTTSQVSSLNNDYQIWRTAQTKNMQRAMIFSLVVGFGLTLFSCSSPEQANELDSIRNSALAIVENIDRADEYDEIEFGAIQALVDEEVKNTQTLINAVLPFDLYEPIEEFIMGEMEYEHKVIKGIEPEIRTEIMTLGMPAYDHRYLEIEERLLPIKVEDDGFPKEFEAVAFPNPASTSTTLKIDLPEETDMLSIKLVNMSGSILQNIEEKPFRAGTHEIAVALQDYKAGTYLAVIVYNGKKEVVRIVKSM